MQEAKGILATACCESPELTTLSAALSWFLVNPRARNGERHHLQQVPFIHLRHLAGL